MSRDDLVLEAVKRFLKPHLEIRKRVLKAVAKPGKTYLPFNTAEEMIADMKSRLKKRRAAKSTRRHPPRIVKAISESTQDFKTGRYEK